MKILVISQYYYPEPFRVTDICETLASEGHDVTVLTGLPNYPEGIVLKEYKRKEHRDEIRNGVRIIRCYEHGRGRSKFDLIWNYFSFALSGKMAVKKLDPDFDVVFINQLSPVMMAWPGLLYAKKHNKKTLLYCYDLWPASLSAGGLKRSGLIYSVFNKVSRDIYKNVDKIAVTSRGFADYFINDHGIENEKLFYLPQFCESIYLETQKKRSSDNCDYVFAGNIGEMQSVETIIKAAELVKNKKICIHIVGDGRAFDNCRELAKDLDNVVFYGRRPMSEMPYFYKMADAMLVTLRRDELISKTLPGKIQSYMAAGKPIIGSIDGEGNYVIKSANCGFVCDAEDAISLAKLMDKFANVDHQQMASNSFAYYKTNFEKQLFFKKLESQLEDLVTDKER